jgi:hypothetical protein
MRMGRGVERAVHALLTPRAELPWRRTLAAQTIADIRAETDGPCAAPVRRMYGRNAWALRDVDAHYVWKVGLDV